MIKRIKRVVEWILLLAGCLTGSRKCVLHYFFLLFGAFKPTYANRRCYYLYFVSSSDLFVKYFFLLLIFEICILLFLVIFEMHFLCTSLNVLMFARCKYFIFVAFCLWWCCFCFVVVVWLMMRSVLHISYACVASKNTLKHVSIIFLYYDFAFLMQFIYGIFCLKISRYFWKMYILNNIHVSNRCS